VKQNKKLKQKMNYQLPPVSGLTNAMTTTTSSTNMLGSVKSIFSQFWFIMVIILAVFVGMVVYYKTIGYYLEFGWRQIYELIMGKADVDIEIGGRNGIDAALKPMPAMPPPNERPSGMPGASPTESPLVSALGSLSAPSKELFNVSRNVYTYSDAAAVCAALDSELATYEQVKEGHERGADWCNYGWVKGQMAVYPTQKETWQKLQKGAPEYRNACGKPGVNGGYFDNPELRFGVNCFGVRPARSEMDELLGSSVALPPSTAEIEFDKKVQKYREQLTTMTVLPFNRNSWSA